MGCGGSGQPLEGPGEPEQRGSGALALWGAELTRERGVAGMETRGQSPRAGPKVRPEARAPVPGSQGVRRQEARGLGRSRKGRDSESGLGRTNARAGGPGPPCLFFRTGRTGPGQERSPGTRGTRAQKGVEPRRQRQLPLEWAKGLEVMVKVPNLGHSLSLVPHVLSPLVLIPVR